METTYWHKQTAAAPLFPNLLWSRPENRQLAGKLLIVGGNAQGFAAPAEAYAAAVNAGSGTVRVMLPDVLQKTVGRTLEAAEFAPTTPSGSFAQKALAELLPSASWADGVLLAGDLGRNSETAILLEKFADKYTGQLTLTKDAADYFLTLPELILSRPDTLFVVSVAQAQKLVRAAHFPQALTFDMDLLRLVEILHAFTERYTVSLIIKHLDVFMVAVNGQVSTTKLPHDMPTWRVRTAAYASTWWLQTPAKPFEAITTSVAESTVPPA